MRGIVERGLSPDGTLAARARRRTFVFLVLSGLACAACARSGGGATDIVTRWRLTDPQPTVDREILAELGLFDRAGHRLPGAMLRVEAHMTHPGMAPVIAQAVDKGNGEYRIPLRFSMAGTWALYLKGSLADHRRIDQPMGEITVRPTG